MKNIKNILQIDDRVKIILFFLLIVLLLLLFNKLDTSYIKEGKLYINEIMPNNTYTLLDNYNEYSDYIEIYNGYKKSINLLGYHLSDSEYETNKWTFPEIIIEPFSYLIIYASGKDVCDKDVCHTNFKLSSKGEVLTLSDKRGNIINKFIYPALSNDLAYGYIKNKYQLLNEPSPGSENKEVFKEIKISNQELYINEYMSSNKRMVYDSLGNYYDFVELYNNSEKDLDLKNIYLSDDKENLKKCKLPNLTLEKGSYLLIYLSDKSQVIDKQVYVNFKLSKEDKYIIVSNGKDIIDLVETVSLTSNVSYGKYEDKWYYFTKPTPGFKNDTVPLEKIG